MKILLRKRRDILNLSVLGITLLCVVLEVYLLTYQISKVQWIGPALLFTILLTAIVFQKKAAASLNYFKEYLKSETAFVSGIGIVIYVILHIPLVEHFIHDYVHHEKDALGKIFLSLGFMFLPTFFQAVLSSIQYFRLTPEPEKKILITALSELLGPVKFLIDDTSIQGAINKAKNETNPSFDKLDIANGSWGKWHPIKKSLEKHTSLEMVYFIISPEIENFICLIEQNPLLSSFKVDDLVRSINPAIVEIKKSKATDFNSFQNLQALRLEEIEPQILKKYKDEEVVCNITGGTALVSTMMSFIAIKGGRKLEYVQQSPNSADRILKDIPIDALSIEDLWSSIAFQMGTKQRFTE
jgi:hypothetical protein